MNIKASIAKYNLANEIYTKISKEKFDPIVDAMQQVIEGDGGTARRARIEGDGITFKNCFCQRFIFS